MSSLVTDVQIKKVLDVFCFFFSPLFHWFVTWTCAGKQREFM